MTNPGRHLNVKRLIKTIQPLKGSFGTELSQWIPNSLEGRL
jgi:hypothetical protein